MAPDSVPARSTTQQPDADMESRKPEGRNRLYLRSIALSQLSDK
jgi:hypothetical protein